MRPDQIESTAKPTVSVVMVISNVERFLAEAIESILGQTFKDFEFIIVDFGSTDKSEEIASMYARRDGRIKLDKIPPCFLPIARNAACALAQGRYIAIMDADDVSLPNRLLWEVEFMEKHPEIGLLGGATEWIDAEGRLVDVHDFPTADCEIKTGDHEIRLELARRCPFCQSTVLMRREAFMRVGGYRPFPVEDYDLWLRVAEHFQIANLRQVVLKYRVHPHQNSVRKRRRQTLCKLAAQASAAARKNGSPDLMDSIKEITPEALVAMGVPLARQENDVALECRQWIHHMLRTGEYTAALEAALEILQLDLKYVDRRQIADLHLTVASLYWRQKRFLSSFLAGAQAVAARPLLVGRPAKPILRGMRTIRESFLGRSASA